MANSADTQPQFSTLADFIFCANDTIADLFVQIVLMCADWVLSAKRCYPNLCILRA
ncbi:MAG: hypothetical protein AB2652_19865 [Candidatus Thiodiazotropha endolucinida]